jgi:nicotinate (nicotinamide) nucleotide adenylyltransferase
MYSKKQQIAILGGSFDPPTIAHIQIACEVYNNIPEISEVFIIPCGDGRSDKSLRTPSSHRLKMLKLIIEDLLTEEIPIKIDTTEIEKGEYIPTYFLLKDLEKKYPDKEFVFIIGSDLIEGLYCWDESEKLVNEYKFIIIKRDNYPLNQNVKLFPKNYNVLESINTGSSTDIRGRIKKFKGKKACLGIGGLTTYRVIKYIEDNKLYC